ncbi:hypothetical protein HG530_003996 [Fusarium avenaceum]|nr:hypothetical protein HG530_003996 [Fusarium avenaceum]
MDFGLSFGAVGDFISIALLIKDIIASLDDCRGSAKQYRELVQSLDILGQTLEVVQKTFEDPQFTDSLEDLSKISLTTVSQIQSCLQGFLDQIHKYETSLGVNASGSGNTLRSISRKIQWKLNEKDVDKFRTEIAGCTMTLKVLLEVTTMRVLQRNHNSLIQERSNTESRMAVMISQSAASLKGYMSHLGRQLISKLDMVNRLGEDLKRSTTQMMSMMFTITGDLSSIRAIVMRLDRGPCEEYFVLDDITGRTFPIHLKTITSWQMLDFVLKERFKGRKGARRIQRKLYSLQEDNTHRGVDWSTPWESAFLPYQRCKRFFTRVVEIDDDPLPFAPTATPGGPDIRFGEAAFSTGLKRQRDHNDCGVEKDETCSKYHQSKRRKSQTRPKRKRDMSDMDADSDSDDGDVQGLVRVHLISKRIRRSKLQVPFQANQTLSFDQLAQQVEEKAVLGSSLANGTNREGHLKHTTLQEQYNTTVFGTSDAASCNMDDVHQQIRANLSSMTSQSQLRADSSLPKKGSESTTRRSVSHSPSQILQKWDYNTTRTTKEETSTDKKAMARKHRIPDSYSLKHWDPEEEPILLLGSVFDANSIGKWIYDWAVYIYGPATPMSDVAGELWLLLIQLAGKLKRSGEIVISVSHEESRDLVEDFIEAGERLSVKFQGLLRRCESSAVKAWKARTEKEPNCKFDKKGAIEMIEAMFGVDLEFGRTEKFMTNARLYNLRFDVNCEEILRNPAIEHR